MAYIEPGLLQVFRWLVGITLLLLSCGLCTAASEPQLIPPYYTVMIWLLSLVLFLYLMWGWLRRKLGQYYLPLALLVAAIVPVGGHGLDSVLRILVNGQRGAGAVLDPGNLIIWLLPPLLLICTQYRWWVMILFAAGTSLVWAALMLPLSLWGGFSYTIIVNQALLRFILFTLIGIILTHISTAQRRQRAELALKNAQLTHYATTLEQLATSRERNRMARELHDTLAHTLSAVAVQLEAIDALWERDSSAARHTLTQTQDLTRGGLREARRALHALRASPLDDLGLVLAIQALAQTSAQRAGLALRLTLPSEALDLRPEVEQNVYRVAEEALNNVVRHANAHTLAITLQQQHDCLKLTVADDGEGFDPVLAASNGHFGLVGMGERAALCGGKLVINSQTGRGTSIELLIEEAR